MTPAAVQRYLIAPTATAETLSLNHDKIATAKGTTDTLIPIGQAKSQPSTWTGLKHLELTAAADKSFLRLLSLVWRSCTDVKRFGAVVDRPKIVQSLADAINAHMPELDELCVGEESDH